MVWKPRSDGAGPLTGRSNAVSIVVPRRGFADVVRLVAGGFVSRLPLGFEAIDDVQLAIEAVVRSFPVDGTHVRVSLATDGEWVTVAVGAFEPGSVEPRMREAVHDGVALRALLDRLVESVEIVGEASATIVMRKRLAGHRRLRSAGSTAESERRALLRAYREQGDSGGARPADRGLPAARAQPRAPVRRAAASSPTTSSRSPPSG